MGPVFPRGEWCLGEGSAVFWIWPPNPPHTPFIPAKAGTHLLIYLLRSLWAMGSRLRGNERMERGGNERVGSGGNGAAKSVG